MTDIKQLPVLEYIPAYWPEMDDFWSRIHEKNWNDLTRSRWHWLNKRRIHFIAREKGRILGNATSLRQEFMSNEEKSFEIGWITDFYVSPELKGKGMGKRLTSRLEEATEVAATFGQSEAAIQCFSRLGWTQPLWFPLLGFVLPGIRVYPQSPIKMRHSTFRDPVIDTIWNNRGQREFALGVRNANTLRERFEGRPDAKYGLWVAYDRNRPLGYIILRIIRGARNRMFGWIPVGLLVDMFAVNDRPDILRYMAQFGVTRLGRQGALLVMAVDTVGKTGRILREIGFSPEVKVGQLPLKTLPRKGFMINHKGKERVQKSFSLTFMDCDAELTF